jgi:hypothetical protein
MALNVQAPTPATQTIEIDCKVNSTVKKNWNCCQLQQYCGKVDEVDDQVRRKSFGDSPENYAEVRDDGNAAAATFRAGWNRAARNGTIAGQDQEAVKKMFYADCAYERARANNFVMTGEMGEPDHIHEIQAGGSATNLANLRWLDPSANKSVQSVTGTVAQEYDPSKNQCVQANCCPAEATHCAPPKTPDSNVVP